MITLFLFAMLQQQPIRQTVLSPPIPAHPVIVDHGQIQIHLHGLAADADWVLGVVTKGNSRVTVSQIHVEISLAPEKADIRPATGAMTPMKSMEALDAQHIHTRPGVVDIDGLASIAEDGVLTIYL